jgi:hypothetical protein
MKAQMEAMQNELKTLRTKVMQTEVTSSLETQREAAHHPLTLVEKKALVKDIQRLIATPTHLQEVIRILSEAGIDTTAEVDFESMPTHVQRILQAFVVEHTAKKAPPVVAKKPPAKKSAGPKATGRPPRTSYAASASASASASATASVPAGYAYHGMEDPLSHLGDMDHDADVLLFPTEDFDEIRADAAVEEVVEVEQEVEIEVEAGGAEGVAQVLRDETTADAAYAGVGDVGGVGVGGVGDGDGDGIGDDVYAGVDDVVAFPENDDE